MRIIAVTLGLLFSSLVLAVSLFGCARAIDRTLRSDGAAPLVVADATDARAQAVVRFASEEAQAIDAFVIFDGGVTAATWGEADVPMNLSSVRKSVLSLLFGIAVDRGLIDLDRTLGEIGIDESATPLTPSERQATTLDLLMARSGVYLPSGAETDLTRATRPVRGSVEPGGQFFYNNWDFNVLGSIFESETGVPVAQALDEWLALPLGMQDFHPDHVQNDRWGSSSDYPTYRIHMSARDLARIGQLVVDGGRWEGEQIVSADWIDRSLRSYSRVGPPLSPAPFDGFGLSWWIETTRPNGLVAATGWGGQYLVVDRANRLVIVARNDVGNSVLGSLWFGRFGTRGRLEDALHLRHLWITAE